MRSTLAIGRCVLLTFCACGMASGQEFLSSLDVVVAEFDTGRETRMMGTVNEIANRTGVAIGFIEEQSMPPSSGPAFQLKLSNVSVRSLLDEAVAADPCYVWTSASRNRVNVLPAAIVQDPLSPFNKQVKDFTLEKVTLAQAISTFNSRCEAWGAGTVIQGVALHLPGLPDGTTVMDRKLSLRFDSGTVLELLNAIFDAAGDDISWYIQSRGMFTLSMAWRARVVTAELKAAEDYLRQGTAEPGQALELLQAAYDSSPYPTLKDSIQYKIANVFLGKAGEYSALASVEPDYGKALPLFRDLVSREGLAALDANVYSQSLDRAMDILLREGHKAEARQWLDSLIDAPSSAFLFAREQLCDRRIWIEVDDSNPLDTLSGLQALRATHSDNETFQQQVEKAITTWEDRASQVIDARQ